MLNGDRYWHLFRRKGGSHLRRRRLHLDLRTGRDQPMVRAIPYLHQRQLRPELTVTSILWQAHFDSCIPHAPPDGCTGIDQPELITPVVITHFRVQRKRKKGKEKNTCRRAGAWYVILIFCDTPGEPVPPCANDMAIIGSVVHL